MKTRLIIIRGNSGSGKSTVAKKLQHRLGYGTMLIPQDVIRREILRCKDTPGNPSTDLIEEMVRYGWDVGYTVVVEGILQGPVSGDMLRNLVVNCPGRSLVYYLDIPFEETLRRHATKPNAHEFGEVEMRRWWRDDDRLGIEGEQVIGSGMLADDIVEKIIKDAVND